MGSLILGIRFIRALDLAFVCVRILVGRNLFCFFFTKWHNMQFIFEIYNLSEIVCENYSFNVFRFKIF